MNPIIYNMDDVRASSDRNLFKVVSLFAGGGGSSTGYRLAGGKVKAINEFIEAAQEAYAVNYPDTYIFKQDVRRLTGRRILKKLGIEKGELDILDGSPPCASFSMAGKRDKLWGQEKKYSDKKQRTDDLFYEYARIIKEVQPKVFVAENVKGLVLGTAQELLGSDQLDLMGNYKDSIYHTLRECGYNVKYKVLNAKHFGVPQNRERLIIIGIRKDLDMKVTFPKGSKKYVTLKEAFQGIEHTEEELQECNIEKYSIYPRTKALAPGEQDKERFNLYKMHPDKISNTLVQSAGNIGAASIVHWEDRKFSVKESIRIMGFPEDYYLGEKYQHKIERLGRAVPPLMMKAVAEHVYINVLSKINS